MENRIFKPLIDKVYLTILITTAVIMLAVTALSFVAPTTLFVMLPLDLFVCYFLISPIFGYVELRESAVFIKFGFIMKKEIPYSKIRGVEKERRIYADSMLSLKGALEHVNIKYNTFDVTTVSVVGNDELILELEKRLSQK